mgnify:CR=1 FL=1
MSLSLVRILTIAVYRWYLIYFRVILSVLRFIVMVSSRFDVDHSSQRLSSLMRLIEHRRDCMLLCWRPSLMAVLLLLERGFHFLLDFVYLRHTIVLMILEQRCFHSHSWIGLPYHSLSVILPHKWKWRFCRMGLWEQKAYILSN